MNPSEEELDYLEAHIPELARVAVTRAYYEALAAGRSVLVKEGDVVCEVFPNGSRKVIKKADASERTAP